MDKKMFLKKLAEASEYLNYLIDTGLKVEDIDASKLSKLDRITQEWITAQSLIETGKDITEDLPLDSTTAVDSSNEDLLAPSIPYHMNLEGSFKAAKSRVVADFAKAYSNRLTLISNGNQSKAARIAGLHVANYKRAIRRAEDARVE